MSNEQPSSSNYQDDYGSSIGKKAVIIILIFGVIALLLWGVSWLLNKKRNALDQPNQIKTNQNDGEMNNDLGNFLPTSTLPVSQTLPSLDNASTSKEAQVEYLSFADFYKQPATDFKVTLDDFKLPMNVKGDVLNYYDVSRKVNLDPAIKNLNTYGFATTSNPAPQEVKDFYDAYIFLNKRQVPALVTSDFLLYYYQTMMKRNFKDVEESLFYEKLWRINESLFEIARTRYEQHLKVIGNVNDPILEGERLEAAHFAVALELLKPDTGQIANKEEKITGNEKFTIFEAENYNLNLPQYLKIDVLKEIEYIRAANQKIKSPVSLYERNYKDFVVPEEYRADVKLNNFYLTLKWLNSNFPLYYNSADCRDCSLDYEDWRIRTITACYTAQDIFNDHNLKNEWARVYKVISYFKGLRSDLTYVNYRDALVSLFGQDYTLESVFGNSNPEARNNFSKLQAKLLEYNFLDIEGGWDKSSQKERPNLGVKTLADFYWPNDYLFGQLTYPATGPFQGTEASARQLFTFCQVDNNPQRCLGLGLDIINLIYPKIKSPYFVTNTNYLNYPSRSSSLQNKLNGFSNGNWNFNNYWTTLKTLRTYLEFKDSGRMPIFSRNQVWADREVSAAVGAWADMQLPLDKLEAYQKFDSPEENSSVSAKFKDYNYVEPNLALVQELIADAEMVQEMFRLLKINSDLATVNSSLDDLVFRLKTIKNIIERELNSLPLDEKDTIFIDRLVKEFRTEKSGSKILKINGRQGQTTTIDLSDVNLLVLTQKRGNDLLFSVGPIFNYQEKR